MLVAFSDIQCGDGLKQERQQWREGFHFGSTNGMKSVSVDYVLPSIIASLYSSLYCGDLRGLAGSCLQPVIRPTASRRRGRYQWLDFPWVYCREIVIKNGLLWPLIILEGRHVFCIAYWHTLLDCPI